MTPRARRVCVVRREVKHDYVGEVKSSDDLALDQVRQLQRQLARRRRVAAESYRRAAVTVPVRAITSAVLPLEFAFATDRRIKAAPAARGDAPDADDADFVRSLRQGGATDTVRRRSARVLKGGGVELKFRTVLCGAVMSILLAVAVTDRNYIIYVNCPT